MRCVKQDKNPLLSVPAVKRKVVQPWPDNSISAHGFIAELMVTAPAYAILNSFQLKGKGKEQDISFLLRTLEVRHVTYTHVSKQKQRCSMFSNVALPSDLHYNRLKAVYWEQKWQIF